MSKPELVEHQLITRTFPGATIPNDLPPEALFVLNLGPYLTEETQAFQGYNEKKRSLQLRALAEKLEEIADILEDVRMEQLVGSDPDSNDEELMEEVLEYLNKALTEMFVKISDRVEILETLVNKAG